MHWERLSWPQMKAASRDTVVVLPTASTEQHGPHLPFGTDSYIAEGIAARLDEACGGKLLILPVLRLGCSEHHMAFPGTLTLRHETFAACVEETIGSVVRHGFRRILVLNSHGGNQAIEGVVAEKAPAAWPGAEIVFVSWWRAAAAPLKALVEGAFPSVGHACEFETSVMRVLHPDLVDMTRAQDDGLPPASPFLQRDMFSAPAAVQSIPYDRMTRQGVYGRPTLATAAKGEKILAVTVDALRALIASCWPG